MNVFWKLHEIEFSGKAEKKSGTNIEYNECDGSSMQHHFIHLTIHINTIVCLYKPLNLKLSGNLINCYPLYVIFSCEYSQIRSVDFSFLIVVSIHLSFYTENLLDSYNTLFLQRKEKYDNAILYLKYKFWIEICKPFCYFDVQKSKRKWNKN